MARKNLGTAPQADHDEADKLYVDTAVAVKYTKPSGGIPTDDIAEKAITVPKIAADGLPGSTKFYRGDGRWSVIVGNNVLVEPTGDYILEPPVEPLDGELVMFEIRPPISPIVVTIPNSIGLIAGLSRTVEVPADISAFIGIRWSERANKWHLMAVAEEV